VSHPVVPDLDGLLGEINPWLRYLVPYAPELGAYFAGLRSATSSIQGPGHIGRIHALISSSKLASYPPDLQSALRALLKAGALGSPRRAANPYSRPGEMAHPAPFAGRYPRLEPIRPGCRTAERPASGGPHWLGRRAVARPQSRALELRLLEPVIRRQARPSLPRTVRQGGAQMQTTAVAVEDTQGIQVESPRFGRAVRRVEQDRQVAVPGRQIDREMLSIGGLLGTLALTNLSIVWAVLHYVG
jgi:hypothetical protein